MGAPEPTTLANAGAIVDTVLGWLLRVTPFSADDFSIRKAILAPVAIGYLLVMALEVTVPAKRPVFGRHNVLTAFYYVLGRKLAIWIFWVVPLSNYLWRTFHLPTLDLASFLSPVPSFLVALLAVTFVGYWSHRLLHQVPLLWHMHKVHHTPTHMYWGLHFHEHFGATVIKTPMLAATMRFLGMAAPPTVGVFTAFMDALEHANVRLKFGWLNYIFILPEVHRFHHSVDPVHYNKNFGVGITLWDHLFGTFHYDPATPPKEFGLHEDLPTGYFGQQIEPIKRMARDVGVKLGLIEPTRPTPVTIERHIALPDLPPVRLPARRSADDLAGDRHRPEDVVSASDR